jgi:hypothetical protein
MRQRVSVLRLAAGLTVMMGLFGLLACGTDRVLQGTSSVEVSAVTTVVPAVTSTSQRTITSVTELVPAPDNGPLSWLIFGDAPSAGIQIDEASDSSGYGDLPGELYLRVHADKGKDAAEYLATAEKLLSLAEKYKQEIYFDRLHVVFVAEGGEVLFDHVFEVDPPAVTTSTTQTFFTHYSAPALSVSPRQGVILTVTVTKSSQGLAWGEVDMTNDSDSAFTFSEQDLQLFSDGISAPRSESWMLREPLLVGPGSRKTTNVVFTLPEFDPYTAGLLYTSSDPGSEGFTASDGLVGSGG